MNTIKVVIALLSISVSAYTQVTIGSIDQPSPGALLDLKQYPSEADNSNSNKGLLLPRVEIVKESTDLATSLGLSAGIYDNQEHVGLMVYSIKNWGYPNVKCPGIYLWSGNAWSSAIGKKAIVETDTQVYDIQGNAYFKASFGTAGVWMTQNLRTTVDPCGKPLSESAVVSYNTKNYYYPNLDKQSFEINPMYGLLYNWEAATNGKYTYRANFPTNDGANASAENIELQGVQGICPEGWHIPSDKEWNDLEKIIAEADEALYSIGVPPTVWDPAWNTVDNARGVQQTGHGKRMKSIAAIILATEGASRNSFSGGFDAYLLGRLQGNNGANATVDGYATHGFMWTSSSSAASTAWRRTFGASSSLVYRQSGAPKSNLMSVRCKKD